MEHCHGHAKLTPEVAEHRHAAYDIIPLILNRWSPRSFLPTAVPDDVLFRLFEAARWAPSAGNLQPWRYIIARQQADRERFYTFIHEGNRRWCEQAPVLAVILAKKTNTQGEPNPAYAFDAGASWAYLALEAVRQGLVTHAMGGFDREKARDVLAIPDDYDPLAVIAIGYRGERSALPADLQEREKPSSRLSLQEIVLEGRFTS
ncbi:nitroreductase family protein [Brevibacillus marinus]|uniref:nitroreductase family protein n=1 Tax=Brevibacillus marinus TaxID=2496837 RepID=UPI000F84677D|nr:nitroreductase family protein [Brevibacillus marinus]